MSKAVRFHGAGSTDVIQIDEVERPGCRRQEVLIEVAAAGLNRADCLQRRGLYPAPEGTPADIPGLEYAGIVSQLGPGVSKLKIGDRVMGICAGAAMATHLPVHEDTVLPVPKGLSLSEAAAIPEVFLTAYDALAQGKMRAGQRVLIHAIGSGVGTAAAQLVRRAGATVIGTSRNEEKLQRVAEFGVMETMLLGEEARFAKELRTLGSPNLIVDLVGAAYLSENVKSLALQGHLVIVGLLSGVKGQLPLGILLAKRATIIGTVLRSRSLAEKVALVREFRNEVLPGFDEELRPVIDTVLPMAQIADAHKQMESNQTFGKIIMCW